MVENVCRGTRATPDAHAETGTKRTRDQPLATEHTDPTAYRRFAVDRSRGEHRAATQRPYPATGEGVGGRPPTPFPAKVTSLAKHAPVMEPFPARDEVMSLTASVNPLR
ncbi:hypothetical protein GCM10009677_26390 [Sphaerisporangium rubeum]